MGASLNKIQVQLKGTYLYTTIGYHATKNNIITINNKKGNLNDLRSFRYSFNKSKKLINLIFMIISWIILAPLYNTFKVHN